MTGWPAATAAPTPMPMPPPPAPAGEDEVVPAGFVMGVRPLTMNGSMQAAPLNTMAASPGALGRTPLPGAPIAGGSSLVPVAMFPPSSISRPVGPSLDNTGTAAQKPSRFAWFVVGAAFGVFFAFGATIMAPRIAREEFPAAPPARVDPQAAAAAGSALPSLAPTTSGSLPQPPAPMGNPYAAPTTPSPAALPPTQPAYVPPTPPPPAATAPPPAATTRPSAPPVRPAPAPAPPRRSPPPPSRRSGAARGSDDVPSSVGPTLGGSSDSPPSAAPAPAPAPAKPASNGVNDILNDALNP